MNYDWLMGTIWGFIGGAIVSINSWGGHGSLQKGAESRFVVVDKYGACQVVRYRPPNYEDVFFLDCQKDK